MTMKDLEGWAIKLGLNIDDVVAMGGSELEYIEKNLIALNFFPLDMRLKAIKTYIVEGINFNNIL